MEFNMPPSFSFILFIWAKAKKFFNKDLSLLKIYLNFSFVKLIQMNIEHNLINSDLI